ncbi:MAG: hypothetical protein ACYCZ0_04085 [Minisyncoccota bacterium]
MNKTYIALFVGIIVVAAGALWYTRTPDVAQEVLSGASSEEPNLGSYAYTCEGDIAFIMTASSDMSSIRIEPVKGMTYPAVTVLADSPTDTGRRFRSAEYEFHGRGESVTLYDVALQKSYSCMPQSKPDEAPFNFGD